MMTITEIVRRVLPMRWWGRVLGRPAAVPDTWRGAGIAELPPRSASDTERRVAVALRQGVRRLPWRPACIPQATAAQLMLRRLGSPGVVVIGLRADDSTGCRVWTAHAWLLGRQGALAGGPAAAGYTATTVFEVPGALRAADVELMPTGPTGAA